MKMVCPSCGGSRRVKTGEPLGTCDGPQYGDCPTCGGSGSVMADEREYAAVKVTEAADNELKGHEMSHGTLGDGRPFTVYWAKGCVVVTTPDWVRVVSLVDLVDGVAGLAR